MGFDGESRGPPDDMETITDRMRKLRAAMGVDLPRIGIARSQRPRSAILKIGHGESDD